jgi:ABC-2 type transport system permease protein
MVGARAGGHVSVRLLLAFLGRDLRIAASYKLGFVFMAVGGLVTLTVFHFIAKTFGDAPLLVQHYGAGYFSFALLGIVVASSLRALQTSFAARLRETQTDGSLEVLLAAPRSTFSVVCGLAAYPIVNGLARAAGLLVLGALFFDARLKVNPVAFACVLLMAMAAFAALGLLSAAFVLVFKRGDPFTFALDTATYLLAGVVYPVQVLPPALQFASRLLPATYALEGLRAAGLKGASVSEVLPSLGALALFCAVLWPASALALTLARRHVERTGTLPQG